MEKFIGGIRLAIMYVIVFIFFVPWTLFAGTILLIIGIFSKSARERVTLVIVRLALRIVLFMAGTRVTLRNVEYATKEPCLLVGNHRSYFDIITTYPFIKGRLGYVAKKEFAKIPPLAFWMKLAGCIFLDRSDPRKGLATINECAEAIKSGRTMFVFPEGTRNHTQEMIEFHDGSYKIADKAGCPIVPVALYGTDEIYEYHITYFKPTHVYIQFGEPIPTAGLSKAELRAAHDKATAEVLRMYRELVAENSK